MTIPAYHARNVRRIQAAIEAVDAEHDAEGLIRELGATASAFRRPEGLRRRVEAWRAARTSLVEALRDAADQRQSRGLPCIAR